MTKSRRWYTKGKKRERERKCKTTKRGNHMENDREKTQMEYLSERWRH